MADRASRAFEISHNPEERYQQQASKERAALAKQQPVSQRLLAWGREYRYPIVGASWLLSMGLAFAIVGRSPYLTTSQKIVQARVYAQGLTLAVLIGTAAFEISDRDKDDDSSDSEHQNPATHHKSYKGEDQWKGWLFRHLVFDYIPNSLSFPVHHILLFREFPNTCSLDMVETEERKIKERDQEIKAQEERDLKAIHKHKTHKNHHHEDHK